MEKLRNTLFAFLLPLLSFGQNTVWDLTNNNMNPNQFIVDFIITSDSIGYGIVGGQPPIGHLIVSNDHGKNWQIGVIDSSFTNTYEFITIADSSYAIVEDSVGNTLFIHLINGHYSLKDTLTSWSFRRNSKFIRDSVFTIVNNSLFAIASKDSVLKKSNLNYFSVYDRFLSGTNSTHFFISDDFGLSWDSISIPPAALGSSIYQTYYNGSDTLYLIGRYFPSSDFISYDKGVSWVSSNGGIRPREYTFISQDSIVGTGSGHFLYSFNGGTSFKIDSIDSGATLDFYTRDFLTFFAYGTSLKVYRLENGLDVIANVHQQTKTTESFLVYPNPISDAFKIPDSICQSISELRIYNQKGQLVKQISKPCHETDVSDFKSGVYVISGMFKGKRFSSKLIVQNE